MLRFEWNGLRIGERVLLHDWAGDLALHPGRVAFVDAHRGWNSVGIRLPSSDGASIVVWPSSGAVHRDPRDVAEPCWQCHALEERAGHEERPLTLTA